MYQQELLNFMIIMGMAQERGSKGPPQMAGILEPHPSGIPSSCCFPHDCRCISLGCFIFQLGGSLVSKKNIPTSWSQGTSHPAAAWGKALAMWETRHGRKNFVPMALMDPHQKCGLDLLPGSCLCKHTALSQWGSFPHIRRGQSWQWCLLLPWRRSVWSGDGAIPSRTLYGRTSLYQPFPFSPGYKLEAPLASCDMDNCRCLCWQKRVT